MVTLGYWDYIRAETSLGDVIADTYLQCIYRGNSSTWKDAPSTKTIKTGSRYHSSEWYLLGSANPPTDIEDSQDQALGIPSPWQLDHKLGSGVDNVAASYISTDTALLFFMCDTLF